MPETRFPTIEFGGSPLSEKNSSRKLADQARLPTPRYRTGVRAYESGFRRRTFLGISVNRAATPHFVEIVHLHLAHAPACRHAPSVGARRGSSALPYHEGDD